MNRKPVKKILFVGFIACLLVGSALFVAFLPLNNAVAPLTEEPLIASPAKPTSQNDESVKPRLKTPSRPAVLTPVNNVPEKKTRTAFMRTAEQDGTPQMPMRVVITMHNGIRSEFETSLKKFSCIVSSSSSVGTKSDDSVAQENLVLGSGESFSVEFASEDKCVQEINCTGEFATAPGREQVNPQASVARRMPEKGCMEEVDIEWSHREIFAQKINP